MAFSNSSGRHHSHDHGIKGRRDLFRSAWGYHDPNNRPSHRHNRRTAAHFGGHRNSPKHLHRTALEESEAHSHLKSLAPAKPPINPWIQNILDNKTTPNKKQTEAPKLPHKSRSQSPTNRRQSSAELVPERYNWKKMDPPQRPKSPRKENFPDEDHNNSRNTFTSVECIESALQIEAYINIIQSLKIST